MPIQLIEKPTKRLVVAERRSEYPIIGKASTRPAGEILYSARLVPTPDMNFYTVQGSMPEGIRMSTAAEELAKQLEIERAGQDPRKDAFFNDLFGKGPAKKYMLQWTSTGLRVPAGMEAPKSYKEVIDGKIHDVYHFTVLEGDKEVGEALVPLGDGRIVTSWNEVNGIARTTTNEGLPHGKHTTHWYGALKPAVDPTSGKRDVAVGRRGGWRHDGRGRCLYVGAGGRRWGSLSDDGFRPVQGSLVLPTAEEIKRVVDDYERG